MESQNQIRRDSDTTPNSQPPKPNSARVIPKRATPDGWAVATLHYSLVPDYDYEAACEGLSDEGIRQELEIDWSASKGKRVYPQFGVKTHQAVEPLRFNPHAPCYCGWDFGQVPAFVITQLNAFHQWLIFPSVSPGPDSSIGIYEFGQMVADHLQNEYCVPHDIELHQLKLIHFGDPAGAARPPRTGDRPRETQSCFEILNKGLTMHLGEDEDGAPRTERRPGWGWKIRPGAVNITARLEAVRARLQLSLRDGLPALVVDPGAQAILDGFSGGYCYPQRADGTYALDPGKSWFSHCLSGDSLIETRRGAVRIDEVVVGDEAWTRAGWRRVNASWCSGINRLYRMDLADGRSLKATSRHRIWTERGWVALHDIRYNEVCSEKRSSTTESPFTGIPTPSGSRIAATTRATSMGCASPSMWRSGKRLMARFLNGITSTIRTAITVTIASKISSALHPKSMGTWKPSWAVTEPSENDSILRRSGRWPLNGIARKKDGSGIGSTDTRRQPTLLNAPSPVRSAARNFSPAFSTTGRASAGTTAPNALEIRAGWITRSGRVPDAGRFLSSTGTQKPHTAPTGVTGVTRLPGLHLVYDIEVEGEHEFYANGILTLNSMDALSYIATRLFHVTKDEDEDDHQSRAPEFVSHAAARD